MLTEIEEKERHAKGSVFNYVVLLQVVKCFVPFQIFCVGPKIYLRIVPVTNILCQSQTFCARTKDDLHSVKLVFMLAQKFLKRH